MANSSEIAVGTREEKGQDVRHIYKAEETPMISQSPLLSLRDTLRLLNKQKHLLLKSSDAAGSVCSPTSLEKSTGPCRAAITRIIAARGLPTQLFFPQKQMKQAEEIQFKE